MDCLQENRHDLSGMFHRVLRQIQEIIGEIGAFMVRPELFLSNYRCVAANYSSPAVRSD